jgi:hypothetical protein
MTNDSRPPGGGGGGGDGSEKKTRSGRYRRASRKVVRGRDFKSIIIPRMRTS